MQSDTPSAERPSSGFLRPFSVFALVLATLGTLGTRAAAQDEWPEQDPVTAFVEGCKNALTGGGPAASHAALLTGKGSFCGKPANVKLLVEAGPRYLLEVDGELDNTWAASPRANWELDVTGAQWPVESGDLELRRWIFMVMTGDWLFVPEFASAITVELVEDDGESEFRDVRLTYAGGRLGARLTVYRASLLPARLVLDYGNNEIVVEYSRWTEGPGHLWPMRTVIDGAATGMVLAFDAFTPPPSYLVDPFARKVPIEDTTFAADQAPEVECKLARNGQWLVRPRVDGEDLGWFVFEPAAGRNAIDPAVRGKLALKSVGRRSFPRPALHDAELLRAKTLTLGPATLHAPIFVELSLAEARSALGEEINGIVGVDFVRRTVVELDRAKPTLRVLKPDGYALQGAEWTSLHFDRHIPCIAAEAEGGKALLEVDIGAREELLLHAPFVRAFASLEKRTVTPAGEGVVRGELARLDFGNVRLTAVPTLFGAADRGAFAARSTDGVLSVWLFGAAHRVVFDLPSQRIAFVRPVK